MSGAAVRDLLAQAIAHHQGGRLSEAEALYRKILAQAPDQVDSLHLLGLISHQRGDHAGAVDLISRAIALTPKPAAEFHNNIGAPLRALGRGEQAETHFRRALSLKPAYVEAHINLGALLLDRGQGDAAVSAFQQAMALRPDSAKAHYSLGNAWDAKGDLPRARASYHEAIRLKSDYAEAHNNLGTVYQREGNAEAALAAHRQALAINPAYAAAHFNLGVAYQDLGHVDQALDHYVTAGKLAPDDASFTWNEALLRLLKGDYAAGWPKYEARWRRDGAALPHIDRPHWNGEVLNGRTIILQAEQGLGDTFQFIRYAALVKARGATVIVMGQPGLAPLLASAPGVDRALDWDAPPPAADVWCPLLSLPGIFGTTLETIPAESAYLSADPARIAAWRARLGSSPGPRVGVAWRGSALNTITAKKSIPAERLASIGGITWVPLQLDATDTERNAFPSRIDAPIGDWADTAAVLSQLDLVITVDTSVAHLAGALGRPAWVLLPYVADWRWLMNRVDSPWYPTLRLFRQPRAGDWDSVIADVQRALAVQA